MRMSVKIKSGPNFLYRDLAQFGSASGLGPEGRWFESSNPDFGVHLETSLDVR